MGAWAGPAGDIDGDGNADLFVANPSACDCCDCSDMPDQMAIYRGGEKPLAAAPWRLIDAQGTYNAIFALGGLDTDGDGHSDFLLRYGQFIELHSGGGKNPKRPTRALLELPERKEHRVFPAGDTNGDGHADAIVTMDDREVAWRLELGPKPRVVELPLPELER